MADEVKMEEEEPPPGPSSTELLMKRLAAMGALDENATPFGPPSGGKKSNGIPKAPKVKRTPVKKKPSRGRANAVQPDDPINNPPDKDGQQRESGFNNTQRKSEFGDTGSISFASMDDEGGLDEGGEGAPRRIEEIPQREREVSELGFSQKSISFGSMDDHEELPARDAASPTASPMAAPMNSPMTAPMNSPMAGPMNEIREESEVRPKPSFTRTSTVMSFGSLDIDSKTSGSDKRDSSSGKQNGNPLNLSATAQSINLNATAKSINLSAQSSPNLKPRREPQLAPEGPNHLKYRSRDTSPYPPEPRSRSDSYDDRPRGGSLTSYASFGSTSTLLKPAAQVTTEDLREQFEAENGVLNDELNQTRDMLEAETKARKELEAMLAHTMSEFEELIHVSNLRRADDVARIGIQDTELTQLRKKVGAYESELQTLRKQSRELEAERQLLTQSERQLSTQLEESKNQTQKSKNLFNQLKKHAEGKLNNAAKLYAQMQSVAAQKTEEARQLASDREELRGKVLRLEEHLHNAQQDILMMEERTQSLNKQVQELSQSASSLKQQCFEANTGHQQAKQQNMELIAINDRYRLTITQLSEEKRRLMGERKKFSLVREDMQAMQDANSKLEDENRMLKSRIFDSIEAEKHFNQRLEVLKKGSSISQTDQMIADVQAENRKLKLQMRQLKTDIEKKEAENKELVGICDNLFSKLDGKSKA